MQTYTKEGWKNYWIWKKTYITYVLHMFSVCNKKITYLHALEIMLHNTAAHKTKRPRNSKAWCRQTSVLQREWKLLKFLNQDVDSIKMIVLVPRPNIIYPYFFGNWADRLTIQQTVTKIIRLDWRNNWHLAHVLQSNVRYKLEIIIM